MSPKLEATLYDAAVERLETIDRRLALAATVVTLLHPEAASTAEEILHYATQRFADRDILQTYATRVDALADLQKRFDADPRPETLGAPGLPVDRDVYNLSLLLSIAFTNHRFEVMQELDRFLSLCRGDAGRIASIGTGTGYELRQMARLLPPDWMIESYEIDPGAREEARAFLAHFQVTRPIRWAVEFPFDAPPPAPAQRYDAIVMCELLEHLDSPTAALESMHRCLVPDGRAFVTMAVNVAQEDHVFLYPDISSCRHQIRSCGFSIESELITPQTVYPPPADREAAFTKGNYVAVLRSICGGGPGATR